MFEDYYGIGSLWYNGILDLSGIDWNAVLSDAAPALDSIYSQPTLLPVEPAPYVEPVYTQPTLLPVEPAPYVEPVYSEPTPQPVEAVPYVEPAPEVVSGIGYQQSAPQPVEAASVYTAPTSGPSDFYASTYVAPTWSPGMDPTLRPGWKPDEAGMAESIDWLLNSPNSILKSSLYPTTVPQAAQDYIKEQAAQGKTLIYDPATEAALGSAISPFISTGVSYKPFDPNNPMQNMGQVFKFTTDGKEPNAPVVFQPGQTYSLYDYKGENLLGQAKTPEELQALIDLSNQRQAQGWTLKGDNVPDYAGGGFGTGSAGGIYARAPQDNTSKMIMLAALTAMGAGALGPFIQGAGAIAPGLTGAAATPLGAGLAAAGVNTVGNLATGASLGDALKSGALAGLSSAAMTGLLGGSPNNAANIGDLQAAAIDTTDLLTGLGVNPTLAGQIASGPISGIGAVGGVAAPSMGSLVGTDIGSNLIQVVANTGSKLPTSVLSGALNAATGTLSGTNYGDQVFNQTAQQPPADQTLEQQFDTVFNAPTTVYGDVGSNAVANAAAGATGGVVGSAPSTQSPDVVGQNDIVVTNKYTPPTFDSTLAATVGSVAPTLIDPSITKPTTPTETEKSSLLNDIMKYYALGSGLLDMLGVGQGGGTAAPTTPYTSTLGALPTFGRGQFTPFQGDYETYGQGPEWNFFGGR